MCITIRIWVIGHRDKIPMDGDGLLLGKRVYQLEREIRLV